jgi:hypothetical protein
MIFEKLPIYVLESAAHSGIDWTHSLLDSHSQVLIMPAFSFYRTIYEIETRNSINLKKKDMNEISEIFSEMFLTDKIYQVKRRKFINNETEKELFKKEFFEYLSSNDDDLYKKIFFGLHFAFCKLYKIDVSKLKCIVIHEHVTWHFYKYDNFFDAKHILVFRNPKAAIAGSIYKLRQLNKIGKVNAFQFDHIILDMIATFEIFKMNKNNFFILQNEIMHADFEGQLNHLCLWMNINFEKSLLDQTFLGKEWKGESVYLAWDEVDEKPDEEYYLEKNVETRWRSVLSQKDILLIETIFFNFMKEFQYKFDNKMNIFKKIKGFYYFFTLYLEQDKYAYLKGIIILRNIIRRLMILSLNYKVANLFRFK